MTTSQEKLIRRLVAQKGQDELSDEWYRTASSIDASTEIGRLLKLPTVDDGDYIPDEAYERP